MEFGLKGLLNSILGSRQVCNIPEKVAFSKRIAFWLAEGLCSVLFVQYQLKVIAIDFDIPSIIQGYAQGYFLMADEANGLGWYTSYQRALIPLDARFRYPRSLRRVLNQERFTVAVNRDFKSVVSGCAARENTWISTELQQLYWLLYQAGWAYSFETWQGDRLAGGILGLAIGGAFIGESMFYQIPEGSKVAMVKLVERLRSRNFLLFDAQIVNPHLSRFGAYIVNDRKYQKLLKKALRLRCSLE